MEQISSDKQYVADLHTSFVEAFKIARAARSKSPDVDAGAAAREKIVVRLGLDRILLLIPTNGALPYLTTCAWSSINERAFETCYTMNIQSYGPAVLPNVDALKASLILQAKKVAEMQVSDLTTDAPKKR